MTSVWEDKRLGLIDKLIELWKAGLSARQIAERLGHGLSRNAVIGKIHRLDRNDRDRNIVSPIKRTTVVKRRKPSPLSRPFNAARFNRPMTPCRQILLEGSPIPSPADTDIPRIATVDLEPHHCRWPCTKDPKETGAFEPQFCGSKRVPGLPYCRDHVRRGFSPANLPPPSFPEPRHPNLASPGVLHPRQGAFAE